MNNLTNLYNNENEKYNENLYLSFSVGDNKYVVPTEQVVEIMKLPHLEYPQKLPNNIVGLLNYNNFTLNIMDIRFYLDIKVTPYSTSNQLLIVKTDENFFGLLINKVEDIITIDPSKIEYLPFSSEEKLIEFFYRQESATLAGFNLYALESVIKKGVPPTDIDIPSLFPQDDESRYKLTQRNLELAEKSKLDLAKNIFTQDKFISFSLNGEMYCINLNGVKEFLKNILITPVPCTPDYVVGLVTLRGNFLTVVDIKKFVGIGESEESSPKDESKNRIIVIETPDFQIGFLVDEIFSIVDIPEEQINQHSHRQQNKSILSEVVLDDVLYSILDVKNILSDERFFIEEN